MWGGVLCWDYMLEITWRIVQTTTFLPTHGLDLMEPGLSRRVDFGSPLGTRLMSEQDQTYEGEMSFNLEDNLSHLFDSFIIIVARSNARALY